MSTALALDLGLDLSLPTPLGRGKWSAERQAAHDKAVASWCHGIISAKTEIDRRRPGLHIGTREWCYLLEDHGLHKDDFDAAELLLVKCRKKALLPLDIVSEDESRAASNLEELDQIDAEEEARSWVKYISNAHLAYHPISFWENQDCYVEMGVEKASLLSLFDPACARYHVAIRNLKGSWDLHSRARMLRRFAYWQKQGKRCVFLYCGDHDVHGLRISHHLHANLRAMLAAMRLLDVGVDIDDIIVERFGIDKDFIDANNLTWIDGLATGGKDTPDLDDPDHRKHYEHDVQTYLRLYSAKKVEASALVRIPEAAEALCRQAILRYVDPSRIPAFEEAEEDEQMKMAEAIKRMLRKRWSGKRS